ncbi:Response regulator receiver domain-containing protein [Loktanella fryxellensis]|uniref:Response regulator receiver domain-containing protein n=1 Tax=Loktanella fryxellensis TaxID=245187 RepID=A0A1H8KFU6_9RHOB|nr:response regulator [Loktanella fryxellensis]SEN91715.1 Response regulator receiver domain-containing protein [Loktanella fryxellensis]
MGQFSMEIMLLPGSLLGGNQHAGYTVFLAPNGQTGLEAVENENPDLILTDYIMPRMDGLAMIAALRAAGVALPIILSSAIPERRLPQTASLAYDAYVGKPYGDKQLLDVVPGLLDKAVQLPLS